MKHGCAALVAAPKKATIVEKNQIVLSAAFRDICAQNGCGVYGRCWMCPPDVGDIHVLMDDLKTYTHGLWYQSIGEIEDSFDIEGMTAVGAQHAVSARKSRPPSRPPMTATCCTSPAAAAACAKSAPR